VFIGGYVGTANEFYAVRNRREYRIKAQFYRLRPSGKVYDQGGVSDARGLP